MAKRVRFLVLKVEGLDFLETWFGARRFIPPNLTRLYQLMLHMATLNGTISVFVARKIGYTGRLVGEAVKRGYVEVSLVPRKASEEVLNRIREMIGKPPREMVA